MTTYAEIVARWARDDGCTYPPTPRNLYCRDGTIYSYGPHFPLARWTTDERGLRCVLANLSEKRSVSTSRHQHMVNRADFILHDVPDVTAQSRDDHKANLAALLAQAEEKLATLKRARALWKKAYTVDGVDDLERRARRYAKAFKLGKVPVLLPPPVFKVADTVLVRDRYTPGPPHLGVISAAQGRYFEVTCPRSGQVFETHETCLSYPE